MDGVILVPLGCGVLYGTLNIETLLRFTRVKLLFSLLRDIFQKWIDKVFYRDTYKYRQMLLDFSNKVNNVLDLNELQQTILDPIVESMHVKRAALLFPEVGTGDLRVRSV